MSAWILAVALISIRCTFVRSSPLRKLLTDDLGLCILQLLQSRAQGTSAQLMQVCLSIFMALRSAVGPCLRILVECFMKQVYIRALVQISGMIAVTDRQQQQRQVQKPLVAHSKAPILLLAIANRRPWTLRWQ